VRNLQVNVSSKSDPEESRYGSEEHHRVCAKKCERICRRATGSQHDLSGARTLLAGVDPCEVRQRSASAGLICGTLECERCR
jgi:hypothetical protein